MLHKVFQRAATQNPKRVFVCDGDRRITYAEALNMVCEAKNSLPVTEGVYYFHLRKALDIMIPLIALDWMQCRSCVLSSEFNSGEILEIQREIGAGIVFSEDTDLWVTSDVAAIPRLLHYKSSEVGVEPVGVAGEGAIQRGMIIILTTGTTGAPKPVLYDWDTLVSQIRSTNTGEDFRNWLLIYPLNHFAGIQQLLHAVVNADTITVPKSRNFEDVFEALLRQEVDSISATPTFWRFFLGRMSKENSRAVDLKQVTLGGEASTQNLLDQLKDCFPHAKIVQVYATTEIGSSFSVNDGKAGFPRDYLKRPVGNVELKVVNDELYVKSPKRMLGYLGKQLDGQRDTNWFPSGDLVEVTDDRVFFLGRKSEIINVGGVKVHPQKVERVILKVSGVENVRVKGSANPIMGQIVVAEVMALQDTDRGELILAIEEQCNRELSRYEIPRDIKIVEGVEKRNEKITRR